MVVGGGIGGLAAALLLGRRGHRVVVVEQEPVAAPASLEDARWWWRSSAPQAAHAHVFPARCRELLAAEAPDVLAALRRADVTEVRLTRQAPGTLTGPVDDDPRLVALAARRSVFEWVLRRAVLAERGVTMLSGLPAFGLVLDGADVPKVTAVRLSGGHLLTADLVVDAAGRRSPVPDWLTAAGAPAPVIEELPGGVTSHTRFYGVRGGAKPPTRVVGGVYDGYACRLVPADAGAFAVTFEVPEDERAFDGLVDGRAFDRAASAVPGIAEWLDPSRSRRLTRVARLTSADNRLRRLTRDGRPLVAGVLPVGDAVCATSPGLGHGVALAMLSAVRLVQAVDTNPGVGRADAEARTLAMDAAIAAEIAPWFHDAAVRDRGVTVTAPSPEAPLTYPELTLAAQRDPRVWTALTRLQNLLVLPSAVLADPDIVARARGVLASGWQPEPDDVPSHDELVALLSEQRHLAVAASGQ
ncbi:Dehydrogenase (flavoprotein) [Cryptosporangium aurantiacum]|uniref:Dehydrogenase (Flavoprotein) n=1 Tax=Cryptosporangium aurantiacum TaxID=134849 RepID=A0A1M7QXJ6_9ACTN|nr:Dehydrogenase (flavoprotein) [Cryptosporangium aurantiacum]